MSQNSHPFDQLPRIDALQVGLLSRLDKLQVEGLLARLIELPKDQIVLKLGPPEILHRASGINRSSVSAQLLWTRRSTRLGLGIETALAHAFVDAALGYTRLEPLTRRQVTPVEWGILTAMLAKLIAGLGTQGPTDLLIDRLGPDSFDPTDLGEIITIRWPVQVGDQLGSLRLWLPESVVLEILANPPELGVCELDQETRKARYADLGTLWRAEVGTSTFPRGLARLRVGGVAPIDGSPLGGTPTSPTGPIRLTLTDREGRLTILAEPAPRSGGGRLIITDIPRRQVVPREPLAVNPSSSPSPNEAPPSTPADVPVTLVVELGRVNMPLRRLADLKTGDVVELGRHAREPVELTSNGRLVARGELVQIDTELGVRITSVFL